MAAETVRMRHFGVVAPAFPSHFSAMEALSVALIERGHQVTFLHRAEAARWLGDARIGFHALGRSSHPAGTLAAALRRAANPGSPWGLRRVIGDMADTTGMFCRELPQAVKSLGIDVILGDQMEAAAGMVAQALSLPFISVACALPINREAGVPLPVMPFAAGRDERAVRMCQGSSDVYDWLMAPHRRSIAANAQALGLPVRDGMHDWLSPWLQLSQTVAGFDFPRLQAPAHLHHVGPLRGAPGGSRTIDTSGAPDLAEVGADRPFIFASLGTLQGHRHALLLRIAKGCRLAGAQLLVAHCGGLDALQCEQLKQAGATWVCAFADQQAVLARADAVVSHAGLNTVMDAIAAGTPVLAVPIAFDQPGVAARIAHAGIGLRASARWASPARIAAQLRRLLDEPAFARRCTALANAVRTAGGTARAADLVEAALQTSGHDAGAALA
ncbi:glycosyltransferase [Janthinobacterium psychrotolerans]|uniref:UDP:flavonoid glycosyltransferase YjiC, YdhE family n=1 Tax=Janthinobacterium psychrotolerans TaxID=1747903 RepID=A0A1A7C8Q9_9BURK|nr:glycosyltransferase [Janthinobacterium psychrotolerans]OBV41394.1 UDP:flavonoid glycosyltransferase YjiC, YdhE family [Janthinobacterium psychrotolerans]